MKLKLIALIATATVLLNSCQNNQQQTDNLETFPVTTIVQKDTVSYSEYVTELHAIKNIEIRARVTGYLEKIHIDEGAHVKEGQLLFSINKREYMEELAKAKALLRSVYADLDAAELELKNVKQLAEKKIVSETEVSIAKNKLEIQKAKLEEAQAHKAYVQIRLSNTDIKASFNGIINRIPHKVGSLIDEGTLLTSLSEYHEIYAYFDVSEKEYLNYIKNIKSDSANSKIVSLILADGSEHSFKGKIETVEGVIDESTGNIAFRAKFPNPDKIIKHGSSGKIRLHTRFKNALLVPQKSTFEIQDKIYVYVLEKDNKVSIRNIEYSANIPHFYIIKKGLNPGEKIIYEGIQKLKSEMIIQPQELSMKKIIAELSKK